MPVLIAALLIFVNAQAAISDEKSTLRDAKDSRNGKLIFGKNSHAKAILFVGFLNGCPVLAKYQPTLRELKRKFGDDLLIVNFDPDRSGKQNLAKSLRALEEYGNSFPLVLDPEGRLNALLGITVASEAAVVRTTDNFELIYRGAIDDRVTIDFDRPEAHQKFALAAINLAMAGKSGRLDFTTANGCSLNLKSRQR